MARLDSIGTAKLVIQMGSIIGREFDFALMQDVLQMDQETLERELERLVDAQLVYHRGKAPQSTYILKHALIQDAAYSSLTRRTRRSYHERVARVLEKRFPDTAPEVLAHHFTEAEHHQEAAHYWHLAGRQAMGAWALPEAINHLERALEVALRRPASPERDLSELQIRVTLGAPLMLSRGFAAPEMEANYARLFELCNQCGETAIEQLFWAYWGLWTYYEVRAIYPRAEEIGKRALEVAERVNDAGLLVGAHAALGAARLMRGALDEARHHFEAGAALYDMKAHAPLALFFGQDGGAMCISWLTWVFAHQGDAEALEARARQSLALAYELRQPSTQGFVEAVVAAAYNAIGQYDLGEQHARKLIEIADEQGFPHWQAQGRATCGWAVQGRGNTDEAARLIREGLDAYLGTGTRAARTYFNGALIAAEIARGHLDEARALLDETYAFVDEGDERFYLAELYRLEGRLILAQGGAAARERARECLIRARDLAREQGARTFELRAAQDIAGLDS
jgi:tetratricopeptide (TPR) repeat protein